MQTEWSMGNGQCCMCGGLGPSFACQEDAINIGHLNGCVLGVAMQSGGQKVLWRGMFVPDEQQQSWLQEHKRYWRIMTALSSDCPVSIEDRAWYTKKVGRLWKDRVPKKDTAVILKEPYAN